MARIAWRCALALAPLLGLALLAARPRAPARPPARPPAGLRAPARGAFAWGLPGCWRGAAAPPRASAGARARRPARHVRRRPGRPPPAPAPAPLAAAAAAGDVPSWPELEALLPSSAAPEPRVIDSTLDPKRPKLEGLVLFRERNGWCPYSERVWLAMELKGLQYTTVLVDNMGQRASWIGGTTPQVRWPSGPSQGESLDIVRKLDAEYPDTPRLWPSDDVTALVDAFRATFPRGTRPSSRAAFLFKGYAGQPVWRSEFEATLDGTDELLGRHGGPFFFGDTVSAADCAWAPFLERYAFQLPCLHAGLNPRDAERWPRLAAWYDAMDREVPAYACRVKGDATSWRRVLAQAGFGNAGVAPVLVEGGGAPPRDGAPSAAHQAATQSAWAAYAQERAHVAATPHEEAAARVVRNRRAIAADAVARGAVTEAEVDGALREVAALLARGGAAPDGASRAAASVAAYLDERLCVPRDLGAPPGDAVRALATVVASSVGA